MGLAPYGEPKYVDLIYEHLMDLKEDGSFKLNMEYFDYCAGLTMTSEKFDELFEGPPRQPESRLTQKDMDLAASLQAVTNEVMLRMTRHIKKMTGQKYLCLAGGVALNCVANGKILREGIFDDLWIQPAAGDAGGSLGAALVTWYQFLGNERKNGRRDKQKGSYLGPAFSDEYIESFLKKGQIPYEKCEGEQLPDLVAELLTQEKVIGWFNGRMEFGPRALGARSILGDARSANIQSTMNLKIKFRESFRPFAPTVLCDKVSEWFEIDRESPYMLLVADVQKDKQREMTDKEKQLWGIDKLNVVRSDIPAVTHVDYSARIQTINREDHELYYELIKKFNEKTGCPVIVNTSFNVRGEPIVCTPEDAYRCFMRTNIDYLVLGKFILHKTQQPKFEDDMDWKKDYQLD
jgi:carbamoyltransferase